MPNVSCRDLSIEEWDPELIAWADRIAFAVPMHTATQIARQAIARVRARHGNYFSCTGTVRSTLGGDVAQHRGSSRAPGTRM